MQMKRKIGDHWRKYRAYLNKKSKETAQELFERFKELYG